MKLDYKKARKLGITSLIIFIAAALAAFLVSNMVFIDTIFFFVSAVLIALDIIFIIIAMCISYMGWRCPKCGTFLGFMFSKHDKCEHCNKYLDWRK